MSLIKTRWTEEETQFVKDSFGKLSDIEIGKCINKTRGSIRVKRSRLGLTYRKRLQRWLAPEIFFIKNNYKTMSYKEMEKHLNVPKNSVYCFVKNYLNFKGRKKRVFPTRTCELCNEIFDPTTWQQSFCKSCKKTETYKEIRRRKWRDHKKKHALVTWKNGVQVYYGNLNKRDYPKDSCCELCGKNRNTRSLPYHHWDNDNPSKGVWVCETCHRICEALENSNFQKIKHKYLSLKEEITITYSNVA